MNKAACAIETTRTFQKRKKKYHCIHSVEVVYIAQTLLQVVECRHYVERSQFQPRTMRLQQKMVPRCVESFLGRLSET